jgi:HK97 family phage major capsid protein
MYAGYAPLTIKALAPSGPGPRRITGIASTRTPDRQGDVIDPLGMRFVNPVPLLIQHDHEKAVGLATLAATEAGITFDATFHDVETPGPLKELIEQTYEKCRVGVFRFVSIAIARAKAVIEPLKEGGLHFKAGEILELSLVTIPANPEAGIVAIKHFDRPYLVAQGGRMSLTVPEQIAALEARRLNARTRMDQILDQAKEENRTLTVEEATEHDAIATEDKRCAGDIVRWQERELVNKALAVPPDSSRDLRLTMAAPPTPSASWTPSITVKSMLPPGARFVRLAMCKMYGQGNYQRECEYAKQFRDTPEVEAIIKAAVPIGTTTDATWAGPLVPTMQTITSEFLALLRPATLIDRIPGIVSVPFNIRVPAQTGGGTYGWVGESLSKPVTKLSFASVTLTIHKAAGIVVFTEELARNSTPAAEDVVRRDMVEGIAQFLDSQFIDPAVAAVAGVNPASVTNGVTPIVSVDNVIADLRAIFAALGAANIDPSGGTLLLSPGNAFALATYMVSGMFVFPAISMTGGTLVGVNVVTSSVLGSNVVFIARNTVMMADDGIMIDISREASVQMDSAPTSPPTAPLVSLWQQNLVGLRADRFITWIRARAAGVQLVTGADYSTMVSPAVTAAA